MEDGSKTEACKLFYETIRFDGLWHLEIAQQFFYKHLRPVLMDNINAIDPQVLKDILVDKGADGLLDLRSSRVEVAKCGLLQQYLEILDLCRPVLGDSEWARAYKEILLRWETYGIHLEPRWYFNDDTWKNSRAFTATKKEFDDFMEAFSVPDLGVTKKLQQAFYKNNETVSNRGCEALFGVFVITKHSLAKLEQLDSVILDDNDNDNDDDYDYDDDDNDNGNKDKEKKTGASEIVRSVAMFLVDCSIKVRTKFFLYLKPLLNDQQMRFLVTGVLFALEKWYEIVWYWTGNKNRGVAGIEGTEEFVHYAVDYILSRPLDNRENSFRVEQLLEFGENIPYVSEKMTQEHMDRTFLEFVGYFSEPYQKMDGSLRDMFVTSLMRNGHIEDYVDIMRVDESRCTWESICMFERLTEKPIYKNQTLFFLLHFIELIMERIPIPNSSLRNLLRILMTNVFGITEQMAETIVSTGIDFPFDNNPQALKLVIERDHDFMHLIKRVSKSRAEQLYEPILFDVLAPVQDRIEAYFHIKKIGQPNVPEDLRHFFCLAETYTASSQKNNGLVALEASKEICQWLSERGLEWPDCIIGTNYRGHPFRYSQILTPEGIGYERITRKNEPLEKSQHGIIRMIGDYIIYRECSTFYCLDKDGYTVWVFIQCNPGVYKFMPNGLTPEIGPGIMIQSRRQDGTVWYYGTIPSENNPISQWTVKIQHTQCYNGPSILYNGNLLLITVGRMLFNTEYTLDREQSSLVVVAKEKIVLDRDLGDKNYLGLATLYCYYTLGFSKKLIVYDLAKFPEIGEPTINLKVCFSVFTNDFVHRDIICLFSPVDTENTYDGPGRFVVKNNFDPDIRLMTSTQQISASSSAFSGFLDKDGTLMYYNETIGLEQIVVPFPREILRQYEASRTDRGLSVGRSLYWNLYRGRDGNTYFQFSYTNQPLYRIGPNSGQFDPTPIEYKHLMIPL